MAVMVRLFFEVTKVSMEDVKSPVLLSQPSNTASMTLSYMDSVGEWSIAK